MDLSEMQMGLIGMGEVSASKVSWGINTLTIFVPVPQMGRMYAKRLAAGGMKRCVPIPCLANGGHLPILNILYFDTTEYAFVIDQNSTRNSEMKCGVSDGQQQKKQVP
jgi:hypothetical protein